MKRFAKTILCFFLPIFLGVLALELGMRSVPNDYTYKNKWLTENISHVRIWTFGSSHGLYGISPKYFSKPAFNSAHVSQPLKYDAFIFDKFIERADSLEWVVLPISYFTLTSKMEDGEEWWRIIGADEQTYSFIVDHENVTHYWRVLVILEEYE